MPANGQYTQADLVLIEPRLGWPSGYGQPRLKRNHDAMIRLMAAKGFSGSVNEIYRTLATQVYYRNLYLSGQGSPAAIPGTSKHGDGWAEDWNTPMNQWASAMQVFWLANEAACGYSSAQGRADGEPWHKVSVAEPSASIAGGGATPIDNTPKKEDSDMKIVSVTNGTIALVGELFGGKYTSPSGGQGFSIGVNSKVYGTITGLTEDEVTTVVNEANARRAQLIAEVTASVIRSLPAGGVKPDGSVDVAAIAKAVDQALSDDFAALPGQVAQATLDQASKRLTN